MVPPLIDVTNTRQEPGARKRSHEDFMKPDSNDADRQQCGDPSGCPVEALSDKENNDETAPADRMDCTPDVAEPASSPLSIPPSPEPTPRKDPAASAPASPTISTSPKGTTTAKAKSPKPATSKTTGEPPAKKPKLTPAEKAAEKAQKEAAKAKKAAELEAAKREREAARAKKAAEKAAELEEKRLKAEQKRAEKQAKEAELIKKAVNHAVEKMIMANFLKPKEKTAKTEKSDVAMTDVPPASSRSAYDKLFRPFFVKTNVTLAKQPSDMDEETREAKAKILEAYMDGSREHVPTKLADNVLDILQIPYPSRRGCVYPSVKDIMAKHHGSSMSMAIDLTTDSQSQALKALEAVPVKSLKFREDVRPAYVGTVSGLPAGLSSLRKVALKPAGRVIPTLDYDYDSEAEWQEEDGEDVEDLDDMDDEEVDQDEDMDDFLDDSEDVGPARLAFSGGMEPESTGLCWENRNRLNTTAKTYKFRMEFILETLEHHSGIDPFSDEHWKPARSTAPAVAAPGAATASSNAASDSGLSPASAATPKNAFQALAKRPGPPKRARAPIPPALENEFKELLRSKPQVNKGGLVALFWSEHPDQTKTNLNALFDALTEVATIELEVPGDGTKTKKVRKHWKFKEDVQKAAS